MLRRLIWVGAALVAAALAALFAMHVQARRDPVVRRATVELPEWPVGAAPVRVALLSDIHIGNRAMDAERLTRIVAQVNALAPISYCSPAISSRGTRRGRRHGSRRR